MLMFRSSQRSSLSQFPNELLASPRATTTLRISRKPWSASHRAIEAVDSRSRSPLNSRAFFRVAQAASPSRRRSLSMICSSWVDWEEVAVEVSTAAAVASFMALGRM